MSVSLYRQYRPQRFADVVGQKAAVDVLLRAVAGSRVGHAYLFSGPRGCGKTSVARILAKALNCHSPQGEEPCGECVSCLAITGGESLDVVEIDGASNNSVDEIRELKSHVTLAPVSSKYKVYIIDEVHMLSMAAFNALLKTLEEPPSHVVFILATTEPHKVPVTIRSRCQHIPFHSIGTRQIFEQLTKVCGFEGASAQPEALWEIARQADGAMRDALSMLEQVVNRASGDVTLQDVEAALGSGSRPALERWIAGLRLGEGSSYTDLKRMMEGGTSPQRIFEELFALLHNLWLTARWPGVADALDISEQERIFLVEEAPNWSAEKLKAFLAAIVGLISQARLGFRSDVLAGLLMLEVSRLSEPSISAISAQKTEPAGPAGPLPMILSKDPVPGVSNPSSAGPSLDAPVSPELPALDWQALSDDRIAGVLDRAREADFVLYCALLDAAFSEAGGCLLLDLTHRYCYEVIRLGRYHPELIEVFPGYDGGIFLRFQDQTTRCSFPVPESPSALRTPAEPHARGEIRNKRSASRRSEKLELPPPPEGLPEGPSRSRKDESTGTLPFDGLVEEAARRLEGELVLVRRGAADSGDGPGNDDEDDE